MSILDDLVPEDQAATPPPAQQPVAEQKAPSGNILDSLLESEPAQQRPPSDEGVVSDVAKSAAIGIPKGLIQAAGTPGDIVNLMPQATPEQIQQFKDVGAPNLSFVPGAEMPADIHIPTSQDIQSKVEEQTGKFYEPKTRFGKYAQTTTSFLANPLTYTGAAPLAVKAGTAAAAAIGSEAAGQALEGLGPLETAGRILGGLIGGHIPNSVNKAVTRSALRNAATTDDLFNASGNLYEKSYGSGVSLKAPVGREWAYDIASDLRGDGFRPYTEASRAAFKTIGELGRTFNNQGTLGIAEIDTVRKALNRVAGGTDREARAIARYAISKIDENVSNLSQNPQWLATGHQNAERVASDITQARAAYAAGMRSNMLEDAFDSAMEKAERRAGTTGKGTNIENTMRQEIRKIVDSRVKRRGFSDDEIETMASIAKGGKGANLLRGIGALAPTGIISGTLGLELGHILFGGLKGMFGVPMVGLIAKKMGERQTAQRISEVAAATRARGFAGPQPQPYTPATGYRFPLFSSTLGQSRGGAIARALRIAKRRSP